MKTGHLINKTTKHWAMNCLLEQSIRYNQLSLGRGDFYWKGRCKPLYRAEREGWRGCPTHTHTCKPHTNFISHLSTQQCLSEYIPLTPSRKQTHLFCTFRLGDRSDVSRVCEDRSPEKRTNKKLKYRSVSLKSNTDKPKILLSRSFSLDALLLSSQGTMINVTG